MVEVIVSIPRASVPEQEGHAPSKEGTFKPTFLGRRGLVGLFTGASLAHRILLSGEFAHALVHAESAGLEEVRATSPSVIVYKVEGHSGGVHTTDIAGGSDGPPVVSGEELELFLDRKKEEMKL